MIPWLLLCFYVPFLLFSLYMLYRNNKVSKYLHKVLNRVYEQALRDVNAGAEYEWRYEAFEKEFDYEYLLNRKFWVWPLSRFEEGATCLMPREELVR